MSIASVFKGLVGRADIDRSGAVSAADTLMGVLDESGSGLSRKKLLDTLGSRSEASRLRFERLVGSSDVLAAFREELLEVLAEVAEVSQSLIEAEKEKFELKSKLDSLSSDYMQATRDLTGLEAVTRADQSRLSVLNAEILADQRKIKLLEERLDELSRLHDVKTDTIESLNAAIEASEAEKSQIEKERQSLSASLREVTLENTEIKKQVTDLNGRLALEESERESASRLASSLSSQLAEQHLSVASLTSRLCETERERDAILRENGELSRSFQGQISTLNSELATLKSSESQLSNRLAAVVGRLKLSDQLLEQARNEISRLSMHQVELKERDRVCEALSIQLADSQKKLAESEEAAARVREELPKKDSIISDLRVELERARELHESAVTRIDILEMEVAALAKRNVEGGESRLAEVSELKSRLVKQDTEIAYLNGILEATRADRLRMHELVQEMRKDVSARMKERVDLVSGLLKKDEEGREKVATEKEVVGSNIISIRNAE